MAKTIRICISCDRIERLNFLLSLRTIHVYRKENAPFPPFIIPGHLIQTATNNIDHDEGTISHMDGSEDTLMVVFQNKENVKEQFTMSKSDFYINCKQDSLTCMIPFQVLNKHNFTKSPGIPVKFAIAERLERMVTIYNKIQQKKK